MKTGALTIALLLSLAGPAAAQFWVGRGGVVAGGGLSVNYSGRHLGISAAVGRIGFAGFGYGYGYYPYTGFYGYSYTGPWFPPPAVVTVVPQPVVVQPIVINVGAVEQPVQNDRDRFIVIRPDPPAKNAAAVAPLPKNQREVELAAEPAALPIAKPAANRRVEADRQVQAGRTAFARQEYGRARDCFRRATTLRPDDDTTLFLLAQVELALGRYDDATTNILDGLKLRPDWPATAYRPRELYAANPFLYDNHLQALRDALTARPDDARLMFLLAVQLWFDGRRDEARMLFEKARKLTADAGPIDLFR